MTLPDAGDRSRYRHFCPIATRWMDNDVYGHVNNVVYYSYFDTAINRFLIDDGGLDIAAGPVIGLCVESHCTYARPVAFPDALEAGIATLHLGRSSVKYGVGIFRAGEAGAVAQGWFVHVFVDRATRTSTPIPDGIRAALARLV
jgi:acyl-CoA thioester hydrolase